MHRPRIVFMGTPALAVPSLEACRAVGDVVTVVTAYGRILPVDVLAAPRKGSLNVHASLLPRWRGAAPVQWAIAEGDVETGVCLMQMEAGLDTGPVLSLLREAILEDDTTASLGARLGERGGALLLDALPQYLRGQLVPVPQPKDGVTLARVVERRDGWLDFGQPALALERRMRAFTPWPGAWTTLSGHLLKVHRARLGTGRGTPGTILSTAGGLDVACQEGSLLLLELQQEGKRRLPVEDFLRGHPLEPGTRPFAATLPKERTGTS